MKGFFAIVVRELTDRRAVFAAAGFAALIPVLLPLAPNMGASWASDIREVTALVVGLGLGWLLAPFLGAGMIGGDLGQGRLGFYFSRPVSGSAIWFGKVLANWLLLVSVEVIVFLPVVVFFDSKPFFALNSSGWWDALVYLADGSLWMGVFLIGGVPLLTMLAAHAIGIMWRARSPWIVLDAAVFVGLVALFWFPMSHLALEVPIAVIFIVGVVVLSVPVVLFLAGWVQVVHGRTDLQRGHRAFSIVLWVLMALVTTGAVGYGAWLTAVDPSDLVSIEAVRVAPEGPWIEVAGRAAGRHEFVPRFLFNRDTGAHLKIPPVTVMVWNDAGSFSQNGTRAAWLEPVDSELGQLVFADLGDERPDPRETPLTFTHGTQRVLSERGDRMAVFERGTLSFYEVENGRLLFATRWENRGYTRMARFVSDDVFRIVSGPGFVEPDPMPIEIVEVDLVAGTLSMTGRVDPNIDGEAPGEEEDWYSLTAFDLNRDRFVLSEGRQSRRQLTVRSARTGEIQFDLGSRSVGSYPRWTDDGRLLRAFIEEDQGWLEVVSVEDGASNRWPLGNADRVALGGESRPGEVSLGIAQYSETTADWNRQPLSINIDTGVISKREGALRPAGLWWGRTAGISLDGRLWYGEGWTLMEWDPVTGSTKYLLGAGKTE